MRDLAPRAGLLLRVLPHGAVLATRVEVAATRAARRRGLLGRRTIPSQFALVLVPCRAVHTWGMGGPIDLVFVDPDGRVVRVCGAVPPWRIRAAWPAAAVVELAPGAARRAGVELTSWLRVEVP